MAIPTGQLTLAATREPEERPARVLLVDDQPASLRAMERALAPLGQELVCASSGEEALKKLLADEYALILLDVHMPGLDGFQTASMIKSHARTASIPIIFVTASRNAPSHVFQGYSTGAVDYLLKPFEPEVLRAKVSVFVDLHEKAERARRQAGMLRDQQIASLERRNELRYRGLTEALPVSVFATHTDGRPYYGNRAWLEYVGAEITATPGFEAQDVLHPDEADAVLAKWKMARETGRPFEIEARLRRAADGAFRWHLVRAVPERDDRGITGWLVIATDVDEKKRSSRAELDTERAAREAAEIANRIKDEFLATLSHELRTPLNAILGWAQMLRKGAVDTATQAKAIATIERSAKTQAQVISDLLDVSRIATGKIVIEMRPVDLEAVVRGAVESLQPAIYAKGLALALRLDAITTPVFGDPTRLQQVVWNLLANAVRFGAKHVEVRLSKTTSWVEISVADDGQGIDPSFLPHVFDRFRQADGRTTRTHGGLGLGLSIARHLVHLHGGTIEATSEGLGRGARFEVRLPVRRPVIASTAPPHSVRPGGMDLAGARVLVVDDEEDHRDLLVAMLDRSGARVRAAASVEEALLAIVRDPPDLLVSDIGMPCEDGYVLIQRVRAMGGERIPAVALTAYTSTADRTKALEAGFDGHLAKPVHATALTHLLVQLLDGVGEQRRIHPTEDV